MARNVEIKCRVDSLENAHRIAAEISQSPAELIIQEDIFFHTDRGRLKLRIFSDTRGQLIYYARDDAPGPKISNYQIVQTNAPAELKSVLALAFRIRGIVRKRRWLYLAGSTRIHLDEVDGLGEFIEVEVVLEENQTVEVGEKIAAHIMDQLGIQEVNLVAGAYIDLLEANS